MFIEEIEKIIIEIERMLAELEALCSDSGAKGGQGSGCHGDRCGRPSCDGTNCAPQRDDSRPRSGVRPSAVNPNRREIEYTEEPSDRPRSGVRPPKKSEDLATVEQLLTEYDSLIKELEAESKVTRREDETTRISRRPHYSTAR
jgi:hypothetical protein